MILAAIAANVLDVELSWRVIADHGLAAEANPLIAGAFSLGLLGAFAWKCALLAVVFSAASWNAERRPRVARLLVAGVTVAGAIGALSALAA
jgi:hypothetical protein